jgi:adenylate kinase
LVLLGPPGAGKGTQAKRLADRFGLAHLSSGDILRGERSQGTELGKTAQQYMDSGRLVPDEVIVAMMVDHMGRAGAAGGYVLDGFPRTRMQAEALDKRLGEQGIALDAAIDLKVGDEVVASRLSGRRVCPACGRVYHLENSPPRQAGRCDEDGTELVQRKDDSADVVAERLKTYHAETEPICTYYAEQGLLKEVDGDGEIENVNARLDRLCSGLAGVR